MRKKLYLTLLILGSVGLIVAPLPLLNKAGAVTAAPITEWNTLVLNYSLDQTVIANVKKALESRFGTAGYRFTTTTDLTGAKTYVFEYPYEGTKAGQQFVDNLLSTVTVYPVATGSKEKFHPKDNNTAVRVCGTFYDWYYWLGKNISFCGYSGTYARSPMYSMDNKANSFYESYTTWGSNTYNTPYYTNFLMAVNGDYSSLGSNNNRISSVKIWF